MTRAETRCGAHAMLVGTGPVCVLDAGHAHPLHRSARGVEWRFLSSGRLEIAAGDVDFINAVLNHATPPAPSVPLVDVARAVPEVAPDRGQACGERHAKNGPCRRVAGHLGNHIGADGAWHQRDESKTSRRIVFADGAAPPPAPPAASPAPTPVPAIASAERHARALRVAARRTADAAELAALSAVHVLWLAREDPGANVLGAGVSAIALRIARRARDRSAK